MPDQKYSRPPLAKATRHGVMPAVLLAAIALTACAPAGWVASVLQGDEKKIPVEAEYRGLDHQTVAVVVKADPYTLYNHPQCVDRVATALASELVAHVPGITVTHPRQIKQFIDANPYWSTMTYGELIDRLGVHKLVYVDLSEYATHVPGNAYVWQGSIRATVGVAGADTDDSGGTSGDDSGGDSGGGGDSDRLLFQKPVSAQYPPGRSVGVVNNDEHTVELGMLKSFAYRAGKLFYDHKELPE